MKRLLILILSALPLFALADNTLKPEERLMSANNESLTSTNGQYELVMQSDGNLVLSDISKNSTLWETGTAGTNVEFGVMQGDGSPLFEPR